MHLRDAYYLLKPLIPRPLQLALRRHLMRRRLLAGGRVWPIDPEATRKPPRWKGWPDNKRFALVLTHDVETAGGHDRCRDLAELETHHGFRSSFNFVARRYPVAPALRRELVSRGFEVGLHGLYHDGKLFRSRRIFLQRAPIINQLLAEWEAVGFRAPAMHHNLEWLHELNLLYDASTFDTDPFEPQADGVRSIFPLFIPGRGPFQGYVELPYTLPQDCTLFVILKEHGIGIWARKLEWIAAQGGMALINTHPDYMNFTARPEGPEEYPAGRYEAILIHIEKHYAGQYWHVLPKAMAAFWKSVYGPKKQYPPTRASGS